MCSLRPGCATPVCTAVCSRSRTPRAPWPSWPSKARPTAKINLLGDWKDGTFPQGWDGRPVTWVSMEDARAYATWAGKRMPHEWEWQIAAQGTDDRNYPWGATAPAINVNMPAPDHGRT